MNNSMLIKINLKATEKPGEHNVYRYCFRSRILFIKLKIMSDYCSRLSIKAPAGFSKNLKRGASVAVNGVCLTVKKGATDLLRI